MTQKIQNEQPKVLLSSNPPNLTKFKGKYELISELSTGGTATVYSAKTNSGTLVAIKHITSDKKEKIMDCELNAFRVRSPFVARLLDFDLSESILVLEFIKGIQLLDLLEKHIDPKSLYSLMISMADSCTSIHNASVVHRDLSSKNFLIDETHTLKVIDFGISEQVNSIQKLPGGTLSIVCPQQTDAEDYAQFNYDIYSIGALIYKAIGGFAPHSDLIGEGANEFRLILSRLKSNPTSLLSKVSDLPKEFDDLLIKCMSFDSKSRFYDANHLKAALLGIKSVFGFNSNTEALNHWKISTTDIFRSLISLGTVQIDNSENTKLDNESTEFVPNSLYENTHFTVCSKFEGETRIL